MSFDSLGLDSSFPEILSGLGYTEPTPVQREAIPAVLGGGDLLVSSQTGSGKTAAFLLPGLQRLRTSPGESRSPRMLVLAPTRELALQVQKASHGYGRGQRLRTAGLVGGMPYRLQLQQLSKPVDLVVATPGRLKDHMDRGSVDLSKVELLVLDEADRMLDMGFQEEIDAIIARIPETRQTLLFSATLEGVVGRLARRVTKNPKRIQMGKAEEKKLDISHHALFADNAEHKGRMLDSILRDTQIDQALVFTATRRAADDVCRLLSGMGFAAGALHGDMHQRERSMTLQRLRDRRMRVLVATDVAARGIDVAGINLVVNYDAPRQAEDYVHRIGRTGRAGRAGVAITFLGHGERNFLHTIKRFTGNVVDEMVIPGLEPVRRSEKRPARPAGRGSKPGGRAVDPAAARKRPQWDNGRRR